MSLLKKIFRQEKSYVVITTQYHPYRKQWTGLYVRHYASNGGNDLETFYNGVNESEYFSEQHLAKRRAKTAGRAKENLSPSINLIEIFE